MIKEWLESYDLENKEQAKDALREIMQEITLSGLNRARFFEKAAFCDGTALRLFYGLDRFSEDLDFSLEKYQYAIVNEFASLGMEVSIAEKRKTKKSNANSAFLKSETIWRELVLEGVIPQNGLKEVAKSKLRLR